MSIDTSSPQERPADPPAIVALAPDHSHDVAMLLDASEVARVLTVSVKTVRRLDLSSRLPRPIHLGRAVRWRRDELLDWLNAGCPPRDEWRWSPDRSRLRR